MIEGSLNRPTIILKDILGDPVKNITVFVLSTVKDGEIFWCRVYDMVKQKMTKTCCVVGFGQKSPETNTKWRDGDKTT